jgi:hypothetical protein
VPPIFRDHAAPDICLARRRGVDNVERLAVLGQELQRVGLVELEGIPGHGPNVHARHLEAGPQVPDGAASGATKEVQEPRTTHGRSTPIR